ncbi:MAG: porin [Pseudomonas sp.]|jgi:phosphate-selective porin OprO/OprP|nr:porin [Pseudomonas sp.]MDD2222058.1 porin [Pseudomonas sp.]MDY0413360.1 porin [Pseudomonas sp.]NLO54655.1 porin [Gammaproteobacteria bacterium]
MIRTQKNAATYSTFAASALALLVSGQVLAGSVTTDGPDITIKTKGGFEAAAVDKSFSFKLGGRIQADFDQFDGVYTKNGKSANEAYFRRAILELSGTLYHDWKYAFNLDFGEKGESKWDEASMTYTGFKPVNIKVGRFDPDFGLEKATSSKWISTIERSMIYDAGEWVNDKQDGMGVQVSGTTHMFYGSAGINRAKNNEDSNGSNNNSYNLRGVIAPMAEAGNVLHFGLNYAKRSTEDFDGRIRSRMAVRGTTEDTANGNRPTFASSQVGQFDNDSAWGLEVAYALGPFSAQSEYLRREISAKSASAMKDRQVDGYNVQLAYSLTGESRGYKLDGGKFDSIKPSNKQIGAWELVYRYDHLSVADADVDTSGRFYDTEAKVHTMGVNWYANDAVKVSANYLKAKTDKVANTANDDSGDAISLRVQYVF